MENVPPFTDSRAAARLRATFAENGYRWREAVCCPTAYGIPMRRRRFYGLAVREDRLAAGDAGGWSAVEKRFEAAAMRPLADADQSAGASIGESVSPALPLAAYLQPSAAPATEVPAAWLDRYARAIDVVDADDPQAVVACLTSAYGRSPVRSGSYLREAGRTRFFRPRELARLMGFADSFRLPDDPRTAYRLLGNSLAVPIVRRLFAGVVEGMVI